MVNGALGKTIAFHQKAIRNNNITTAVMYPLTVAFGFIIGINPWIYVPIVTALGALTHMTGWLGSYVTIKRLVKNYSNGKITYKQYKQLVKSEELGKWLNLNVETKPASTETVQNTAQDNSNINGVNLSAEEIAVLKKLMDKKIIDSVTVSTQNKPENQQPTTQKTDNGRNS